MNEEEFKDRMSRVDALLWHTLSNILRKRFGQEAVAITFTGVKCEPDLRSACVKYSVLGDNRIAARDFFRAKGGALAKIVAGEIILKRHPKLHFQYDDSLKNLAAVDKILHDEGAPAGDAHPELSVKSDDKPTVDKNSDDKK